MFKVYRCQDAGPIGYYFMITTILRDDQNYSDLLAHSPTLISPIFVVFGIGLNETNFCLFKTYTNRLALQYKTIDNEMKSNKIKNKSQEKIKEKQRTKKR